MFSFVLIWQVLKFLNFPASVISKLARVAVGEGVGIGDAVAVGVAEGVGVGVAMGVGVAVGRFTATPLFHTSFFPDLMQVYLIPAVVLILPNFLHVAPGLMEAIAIG